MSGLRPRFWEQRDLESLDAQEWEALCDGCGQCCLHKIIDEDEQLYATRVACHMLDLQTCRCADYTHRLTRVPGCLQLTPALARTLAWLPPSCAYRRLAHGQPLPWWHPLLTGDAQAMRASGASVSAFAISERDVDPEDLAAHLIDWLADVSQADPEALHVQEES